ncbi:site-specific integrase [Lentilactobacillus sp. Marseille-Q4993]|uniref:site-specific integrase n=1 Tax=Lentilactobacillus sp. Marseille-Q4993 TaxID=3039492 RepID=UPI0024BBEE8F|nr:site-specific integrase [Lentilactobacillus sp. Marseille-Q4993]
MDKRMKLHQYFLEWMNLYKRGAVREVTFKKYIMTHRHLVGLAPELRLEEIDRLEYQQILNDYAQTHEKQTVMDFHRHLRSALIDAMEENLIDKDPTRKAIIKGRKPGFHKPKFLNQKELQLLLDNLELTDGELTWDYFILLVAKTGLRFSEALGLTPADFDFARQTLNVSKTWDYKSNVPRFAPTKNESSKRRIQLDWQTVIQFAQITKGLPLDDPIFVRGKVYNDTVNHWLERLCKRAEIPVISVHGLRHTHASLLLYSGVSIASVARRLGHSNMNTTQQTYLHIIQELENQDNDKVMKHLASLI